MASLARVLLALACALPVAAAAADTEVARLLERAGFWRERSRDDLAREELAKAFRLAPGHPQALAMLARIQLAAGQDRDAAATLERLRAAHPGDPEVKRLAALLRVRGPDREKLELARQLARAARFDEAVPAYRALFPEGFPDDELALEYARALAATRTGREQGAALIADLARKHAADPRYQVALAVDQSWRKPVAPATLRALRELSAVPSVARQAVEAWRRALLAMDPTESNRQALRDYVAENPGDSAIREKLDQMAKDIAAGRHIRPAPVPAAAPDIPEAIEAGEAGLARLREGRHAEALGLFERAQRLDPPHRARWSGLERTARFWMLVQQATAARQAGALDTAKARVEEAIALDPAEAVARAELARIQLAQRNQRVSRLQDAAKDLVAQRRDAEALSALEEAAALAPDDPWLALDLARLYDARSEPARGQALFERLAQRQPEDADTRKAMGVFVAATRAREANELADASRAAQREGDVDRAVVLELRALALQPSEEAWRMRRLAELRDQQLGWLGGALDALHRSGSGGKSRLDAQELVLGYRQPWTQAGRAFIRVAPTRISSGTLDFDSASETASYGTLLLCQPRCAGGPPESTHAGVALAAGSQIDDLRLDLGVTPLGFPVVNVVGGALYEASAGGFSYSIDVARRPVVSSLLTYAGSRDPASGITWGGVVASGVRLNVSRDRGGDYGAWGLAGMYRLTGMNVVANDKAELMAGGYRRFVNEENRQLAAGLTAMLWRFSEEAGGFTLGHGGYYSPAKYQSLSLPVTFAMRSERTSFYARASVSVSRSQSWRAPYFPTDPRAQAQAEALAPANGIDPFYAAGKTVRAYGRSFAAAAEHRLAPDLFIGARLEIERSTNYTPNRLLLYVRKSLGGATGRALAMPPEPVVLPGFQY